MVDMSAVYQNRGPLNAKMLRGEKVISFSLVGDNPAECIGAIDNSKKAAIYFPGWKCRYYVAKNVPSIIIETIRGESNTEVITMNTDDTTLHELWPLIATEDHSISTLLFRHVTGRLTRRDSIAVEDWMRTNAHPVHIIRDHPFNNPQPIPFNSWGLLCDTFRWVGSDVREYIKGHTEPNSQEKILYHKKKEEVTDKTVQNYLNKIYVNYITQAFIHDSFPHFNPWSCRNFEQGQIKEFSTGIPVDRNVYDDHTHKYDDFIGQQWDEENRSNKELRFALEKAEKQISDINMGVMQNQKEWIDG